MRDWGFSNEIYHDLECQYIGIDCAEPVIQRNQRVYKNKTNYTFIHLDVFSYRDNIPEGDIFIIKDVLQHFTNTQIEIFLDHMLKVYPHIPIMIINCCNNVLIDRNIITGKFYPLNPAIAPLVNYELEELMRYRTKIVHLVKNKKIKTITL